MASFNTVFTTFDFKIKLLRIINNFKILAIKSRLAVRIFTFLNSLSLTTF